MLEKNNIFELDTTEVTVDPSTSISLPANCGCTTAPVSFSAATTCRHITIPITISNLCPNKEFLLLVTVFDNNNNPIGQTCSTVTSDRGCNTPITHNVSLIIKKPACSTDRISVNVEGNYVRICNN